MLEFVTTPEFARWFDALPEADAEDVATAVEVLSGQTAGPHPEGSSTLLLWYECEPSTDTYWHAALHEYLYISQYARTLVERLERADLRARYSRLQPPDAQRVLQLLEIVRRYTNLHSIKVRVHRSPDLTELRRAWTELDALLGHVESPEPAVLRELQVRVRSGRVRVLFGADWVAKQGLLVLGERLDRRFYGDSVRRALRVWEQFRAGERDAFLPLPAR